MAQEAQMPFYWRTGEITYLDKLERFAALVASAERERIKQANAPEIEHINAHIKELENAVIAERKACEALHDHEDVQAPVGNSSWGEAYQEGWGQGTAAYRDAIQAREQA